MSTATERNARIREYINNESEMLSDDDLASLLAEHERLHAVVVEYGEARRDYADHPEPTLETRIRWRKARAAVEALAIELAKEEPPC